jgi:transcriptional regulator with XRE-family HTH domain
MEHINEKVGRNLQRIRKNRGLSLDKVAELTGVSKAMLRQIERGESSPSVSTVWKIANGLRLSFTSFLDEDKSNVSVVNLSNLEPIIDEDGKYRVYPLFPFDASKHFEIFSIQIDPGYRHYSEAHNPGVEEYITVTESSLSLHIGEQLHRIELGNAIRFFADQPHIYVNETEMITKFQLIICYPG